MLYDLDYVIRIGSKYYEQLNNHPQGLRYRFFTDIHDDDYDYIEKQSDADLLDQVFKFTVDRESDLVA